MEEYNLLNQLLQVGQAMPPGYGVLAPQATPKLELQKKVKQPVEPQLAEPIVAAFTPRTKFPTSLDEFNSLIKRQTEGLAGQREGLKQIESQIAELQKPQETSALAPILMAASDLVSGTQFMKGYQTPEQKEQARKAQALNLQMQMQKAKGDLTDKEIDLFKAQYQDSLGREKMAMEEKLAKMKLGADAGMKLLPGQEAADKDFGKEYADWNQKGGRAGYLKSKQDLEVAINELSNDPTLTGTIAMKSTPSGMVSKIHPDSARVEQKVKSTVIQMVKQLGANPTDTDLKEIQKTVWDKDLPVETNIEKIKSFLQEQERKAASKDEASKYFERTRGTLMGQGQATKRGADLVQGATKEWNGKTYKLSGDRWVEVK